MRSKEVRQSPTTSQPNLLLSLKTEVLECWSKKKKKVPNSNWIITCFLQVHWTSFWFWFCYSMTEDSPFCSSGPLLEWRAGLHHFCFFPVILYFSNIVNRMFHGSGLLVTLYKAQFESCGSQRGDVVSFVDIMGFIPIYPNYVDILKWKAQ